MTVKVKVAEAVTGVGVAESVTWTVIGELDAPVGVPVIAPVVGFRLRPAGRLPEVIDHVCAPTPPVATSVAL